MRKLEPLLSKVNEDENIFFCFALLTFNQIIFAISIITAQIQIIK